MMFKYKLATFIGLLILAGSSFAVQSSLIKCPKPHAIQTEGLTESAEIMPGVYLNYNLSNYDTPLNWVFLMGPIEASSDEASLLLGNSLLGHLNGNPSPEDVGEDTWVCQYDTGNPDLIGVAIHSDQLVSPLSMSRYLRVAH